MTMGAPFVEFSHLWKREQAALARLAEAVPAGGVIVEIGTDFGGGAVLMHAASAGRATIHTIDMDPTPQARENLAATAVEIIAMRSDHAAGLWQSRGAQRIDLLFIDGGHDLQTVFGDVNAWLPFMAGGGIVAMHDYDLPQRGGLKHLGVQVCVDAIARQPLLKNVVREERLIYGTTISAGGVLPPAACSNALADIAGRIRRICGRRYAGWDIVADVRFAALLKACLDFPEDVRLFPAGSVPGDRPCLVSAQPEGAPQTATDEIEILDSLTACYILDHALRTAPNRLKGLTADRREFAFWQEALDMEALAHGPSPFPQSWTGVPGGDISAIAQVTAREQVRLALLSRMLQTFVDWTP